MWEYIALFFLPLCCELPVLLFTLEYWITVRRCLDWLIVKIKLSFGVYWIGHLCSTWTASIIHVQLESESVCMAVDLNWDVMHLIICLHDHVICKENLIYSSLGHLIGFYLWFHDISREIVSVPYIHWLSRHREIYEPVCLFFNRKRTILENWIVFTWEILVV